MQKKVNKIGNWDASYENFESTYSEAPVTPANLANYIQHHFVLEDIRRYLSESPDLNILECGCGGARASLFLALRGFCHLTCSDYAPEAIRLAKANFDKYKMTATFVQDDLLNSNLAPGSFDCVMSFGLLEHFEDINVLCKSITRLVKPGGIQIHCVVGKKFSTQVVMNYLLYIPRFLEKLIYGKFDGIFSKSFRDFPHYESTYIESDYRKAFEAMGSEILKCEAGGVLFPFVCLPVGIGDFIVRHFSGSLYSLLTATERSESKIMHFLAPTFYIVCRKNI